MELGLKGKVALVTGAGKGMGLATANAFADEGAKVVPGTTLVIDGGLTAQSFAQQERK